MPIKVRKSKKVYKKESSKKMKFKKNRTRKNKNEDKIDFDDIKWGSFTKQFNAYKRKGHTDAKNLREFAKIVLKPTENFAEITKKRARFYLNVLDKK